MSIDVLPTVPQLTPESLWDLLAGQTRGVLATIKSDGRPQLSNIGYTYDADTRLARIIAGDFRAKAKNARRDPRVSLHVSSDDFRLWLVAEGNAELTPPAQSLDDETGREILDMYAVLSPDVKPEDLEEHLRFYPILGRLVIRFRVDRLYGGNGSAALGISAS